MLAGQLADLAPACQRAVGDQRLIAGVVEHRPEVVGHAAVDGDPGRDVALDRLHRVQGDGRVGYQRPARLQQQPLVGTEVIVHRADDRIDVPLGRRRPLTGRVRRSESATEVVDAVVAERRDRSDRLSERLELEQLRADVEVQPDELERRALPQAGDRGGCLGDREAELRVRLSGRDLLMRVARDAGRDPDQDLLAAAELARDPLEALELVERVEHDVAHTRLERLPQLACGLGVAVQIRAPRIEAAPQRQRELAPGGDVARESLLGERPVDGRARERLGGEQDVEVAVASGERIDERAGAGAQVVLDHYVDGSPEFPRKLDRVAAAELEPSALVDARAERQDCRQRGGDGGLH